MQKTFPKKRFGQNFLIDQNIARKIVNAIDQPHPRLIIEIGPGRGILTEAALEKTEQYLGIEIDSSLTEMLQQQFSSYRHFAVIQQDFLKFDLAQALQEFHHHSKVILGNIPYNITSPILFKLFDEADDLDQAVMMVQWEVGNRLRAREGNKDYGLLSIFSQIFAEVEYLFKVPAKLFFPKPKVDSAVLRLTFHKKVTEQFADFELFRKMLRTCFQQRRKMLRKSLSHLFGEDVLIKLNISLTQRPEQLSIPEWIELYNQIYQTLEKR